MYRNMYFVHIYIYVYMYVRIAIIIDEKYFATRSS